MAHSINAQHRIDTHMQKQSRAAQNQRTATQVREDTCASAAEVVHPRHTKGTDTKTKGAS